MSDSDNDINDDRFQEMGQVMTGISGRMDELANPCDFQFDLQEAFKKLAIATKEGVRTVHLSHFSHIKQIFRRLSVVEGRRQAFPTFAQDPEQPLPPLPSSGNSMASRHLCMSYSSARV